MASDSTTNQANWYHHFADFQYSSHAFYDKLQNLINEQNYPGVKSYVAPHSEGGILSAKRDYLSVHRNETRFDICAAPFGKGFFISWWLTETSGCLTALFLGIPKWGEWLSNYANRKSFYHVDSQTMFKTAIHSLILAVIDDITEPKGIRLSESERLIPSGRKTQTR